MKREKARDGKQTSIQNEIAVQTPGGKVEHTYVHTQKFLLNSEFNFAPLADV